MQFPLVSICIPVHNAAKYLVETLEALLVQTYPHTELICVNDHSTDASGVLLDAYRHKVKVLHAEKRGAAAARNLALANASGSHIIFFDADDLVDPGFVQAQVRKGIANPGCVVVSSWGRFFNDLADFREDEFIIRKDLSFHEWVTQYWTHNRHMTPPGRVLLPREIIDRSGVWNEELSLNDDLDFYARLFSNAARILFNPDALFYYRSGNGGLSSKTRGFRWQLSNFQAIESATKIALGHFVGDPAVKLACANMWQMFIYDNYPFNRELTQKAASYINKLGAADFPFPGGGTTGKLARLIGWKATKRLKLLLE